MSCTHTDVIVIGGGIAGASVAAELVEDAKVILLEGEHQPGYHSTGRSAALFSTIYGNASIRALSRASRQFFETPRGVFEGPLVSRRGTLFIASQDQLTSLDTLAGDADVASETCRLEQAAILELLPVIQPRAAIAALYEEHSQDIDVNALHRGYLASMRARGGQVVRSAYVQTIQRASGLWRVRSTAGDFVAPRLVNAAGAWADEIAKLAGVVPVGLKPLRRTIVTVDGPVMAGFKQWPLVIDAHETLYFKPDAGRLLVSPADEHPSPPCDCHPEELDVATAVDRLEQRTTLTVTRIINSWAGLRTFATDRTPVVGEDLLANGFFWVAGQGGYGIQIAPALARLAAALVLAKPVPADIAAQALDVSALSPGRFHIPGMS